MNPADKKKGEKKAHKVRLVKVGLIKNMCKDNIFI
jgi:hypothetical protein